MPSLGELTQKVDRRMLKLFKTLTEERQTRYDTGEPECLEHAGIWVCNRTEGHHGLHAAICSEKILVIWDRYIDRLK